MGKKMETARGRHVRHLIRYNFGFDKKIRKKLAQVLNVSTSTVYPWTRTGIPYKHIVSLKDAVEKGTLKLPPTTKISDYLKEPTTRTHKIKIKSNRNEWLLAFIYKILMSQNGIAEIEVLMKSVTGGPRDLDTCNLWRWAYRLGGVPLVYHKGFVNALYETKIATKFLNYDPKLDNHEEVLERLKPMLTGTSTRRRSKEKIVNKENDQPTKENNQTNRE